MKGFFARYDRCKSLKLYTIFILLCTAVIAVFFVGGGANMYFVIASANDNNALESIDGEEELNSAILEQIENLDLDALEEYISSLGVFSGEDIVDRIVSFIKSDGFNYENFGENFVEIFFSKVIEILPCFLCIAAISLLSGLLSMLKSDSNAKTASEMLFLITYAAALVPLLGVISECISNCYASITQMKKQMDVVYPILLTLMSASGSSLSAAVCRPAVVFFSSTIVTVMEFVVFPLTITIIVFSMAGNITKELKISKFTAFFKSINKWIIGISVSVFGIFFTLQGITAASYDGVVRRAAKYAIGNGVPIVGGFLSGGFDLAVAGSVLIKNALGNMSIFLLLAVVFEPLVLLIATGIFLRLTAAIAQPFGDGKISDFLEETAENLHYCMAGILFTAFLYFLTILLAVYSSEALF